MSTEHQPMSDERRAEIDSFADAMPPSMAYARRCFDELRAEIDRQAAEIDRWIATADDAYERGYDACRAALGEHP